MLKVILVLLLVKYLFIQCDISDHCSIYEDCFSCNYKGIMCEWNGNKCQRKNKEFVNSNENYWERMISCTETKEIQEIMKKYCGDLTVSLKNSFQSISLPIINNSYGRDSLLCMYVYKNSNPKDTIYVDIEITYQYFYSVKFLIGAIFKDGELTKKELLIPQNLVRVDNAKEVTLYFLQSTSFSELPFVITFTLEKSKISITLIITIVLFVFLCIICGISIYLFSQKIARRNKIIRNSRQEEINNVQIAQVIDQMLKEARLKEIDNMFTNVIKAIPFSKNVGKYNTSCTICLEEFQDGHIVCVTECLHLFHVECLKKWLITNVMNPKCPNCVNSLLKETNMKKIELQEAQSNNVIEVEQQLNVAVNSINHNSNNRVNKINKDNTNDNLIQQNEREVVKDINKISKEKSKENKKVPVPIVLNRMNNNNRNLSNLREYELTSTQNEIMEENNINQISNQSKKEN